MPREIRYFFDNSVALQVREEGRVEGRIEGRALMVLRILEWREIPVCFALRERVLDCYDLDQLEVWARRALTVERAEDMFSG
ncbi:hypothetical protein DMH12_25930 [Streptomyces sp. WAC 04229]|uniref:hypothetical protein n=1 Tax=Streptomyces sp. WAC 04229 TaxID=2203206 RepID=UPI000F74337A|nr:hypothetical protein [Streptomyces sp. WAC 04229]RSN48798.1 hypothetical protein DMH12_25930 [Streptomyces sp. WAC 04229]